MRKKHEVFRRLTYMMVFHDAACIVFAKCCVQLCIIAKCDSDNVIGINSLSTIDITEVIVDTNFIFSIIDENHKFHIILER